MSRKRIIAGIALFSAGAVLLSLTLLLLLSEQAEDRYAGQESARLLDSLDTLEIPAPDTPSVSEPVSPAPEKAVMTEKGYEVLGTLSIPELSLTLPVLSDWDYDRLKIAPCRQFGLPENDDLVIAAHNYESHFGLLKELESGDPVTFTDADGHSRAYTVEDVRTLRPTEVDAVRDSGYPLVLYTCTYGGKSRTAVFCSRSEKE